MDGIGFTVFTPIFNRSELTERTFASLCAQTVRDFEWLIVDDGSTDDTRTRAERWQAKAPFPVRYHHQRHQGKHYAYNLAISLAEGPLFAVLDSDDAIAPNAIERLLFHWNSIDVGERAAYSGVTCLCVDETGNLVGRPFPRDVLDCRHFEAYSRFGASGEKWGCHRTEVLREFPYPTLAGEGFCPDALVWNRIAQRYLIRHVNEALRVFYMHCDTITSANRAVLMRNPRNASLYYGECLQLDVPLWWKCKQGVNYVRYSLHAGTGLSQMLANSAARKLTAALSPAGCAFYISDLLRTRNHA